MESFSVVKESRGDLAFGRAKSTWTHRPLHEVMKVKLGLYRRLHYVRDARVMEYLLTG